MSKHIRASIRFDAIMQIDDSQGLFRLAEAVPEMKEKLLKEIKRNVVDRSENLTVDSLTFEEMIMPDPTRPSSEGIES